MTAKQRKTATKTETVELPECTVELCTEPEFEAGAGLCHGHFTTRLDLREAARHG